MNITFYTNTYDRRVVDKSNLSPASIGTVTGTLRRETDVRRPVIQLALADSAINDSRINYAYIAEWGKYYYITDKRVLREGLCEFTLQEDVLMTFRTDILAASALIERWEQNESPYLADAQRPITASISREIVEKASTIPDHFNPELIDPYAYPFALTLVGGGGGGWKTNPTGDVWRPNPVYPVLINGPQNGTYAMTITLLADVLSYLTQGSISSAFYGLGTEGIISCICFPFDLVASGAANPNTLAEVTMFGTRISTFASPAIWANPALTFSFGKFKSSLANATFADMEPYRRATLYLPYIGMVDVPMQYIGGNGVLIEYNVDPRTGACQAMVYALDANDQIVALIKSLTGQIGIQIPINNSNAVQKSQADMMAAIKMAIGAATSFANPAAGVAQIAGAVSTATMNPLTMSGQMPNSDLAIRARSSPYILIDSQVDETPSGYGHYVGYPSGKVHTLGSMSDATLGPRLVKVQEVYWTGSGTATQPEMEEIFSLLKAGVLI